MHWAGKQGLAAVEGEKWRGKDRGEGVHDKQLQKKYIFRDLSST